MESLPRIRVMGVEYAHVPLEGGDDLYVTEHGLPFLSQLMPDRYWTDEAWFRDHHQRLSGTGAVYRIRTKGPGRGKDIVLKWNRMGQDVPGATEGRDLDTAEFNSPFEEFSLAIELRGAPHDSAGRLLTHKPLAIYVPRERVELDRLGRKAHKFQAKRDNHVEIELDMHRQYAVIYEWVKGIDAAEARQMGLLGPDEAAGLVARAEEQMRRRGFRVRDSKAQHVIVRPDGAGGLLRDRAGEIVFASIDFELLERTPDREQAVRAAKRKAYLVKQAHRFEAAAQFPPHLAPVSILGVEYVYGHIESTDGALWVVGRDAELFDYFLPEKWRRTPRRRLSVSSQIYQTTTKDGVRLVWRVSRVGELPDTDPFRDDERKIIEHGYNSPFEEVALSLELMRLGIATTYPRAIYMTGEVSELTSGLSDDSRYRSHAALLTPDGKPILRRNRDYIILWGYWNAPDEKLAERDEDLYTGVNALSAYRQGLLSQRTYLELMRATRERLARVGVEDLNLRGTHLLLSLDNAGRLVTDSNGLPAVRICNFELLRKTREP